MLPSPSQKSKRSVPRICGAVFGVALMLMAAAGGARQSSRFTEEIQEIGSHTVEAVMRSEESRTPSLSNLRVMKRDLPRVAASRRCQSRGSHNAVIGHFLANGLNAPLVC